MSVPLRNDQPAPQPDEYRVLVFDMAGATLADETHKDGLDLAIRRARALSMRYGGEVARVRLRGFEVGVVVEGRWVAR